MPDPRIRNCLNLSGVWQGVYGYPNSNRLVPFSATLSDHEGWLNGHTDEVGTAGEAIGQTLYATLQGRRSNRSVTLLKLYDCQYRIYDAVQYEGEVSDDGLEISGRWIIAGAWSGTFLMVRSGSALEAADKTVGAQV